MQRLLIGALLSCLVAIGSVYAASAPIKAPPKDLSKIQKAEWDIGIITGLARHCGSYNKAHEIRTFMKRSPYYERGLGSIMAFDSVGGCGKVPKYLEDILGKKEFWQGYINVTYPEGGSEPREVVAPESSPEHELAIMDYIKGNEHELKNILTSYNRKHELIESSWAIGAVYQVWNISDFDIRRANANGACVAFTVSVGQSAPKWGVLPLELQWADDKLKIIGHDCN